MIPVMAQKSDLPEVIAEYLNGLCDYAAGCPPVVVAEQHLRDKFRCGPRVIASAYKILREQFGVRLICNTWPGIGAFDDKPPKIVSRKIFFL